MRPLVDVEGWTGLLPAARQQDLDVVVVVDDQPSMQVWAPVVADLADLLARHGHPAPKWVDLAAGSSSVDDVTRTGGPSVLLVLTDGASSFWTSLPARTALGRWGRLGPTALVHMLPEPRWHATHIPYDSMELRAGGRHTPNSDWECRPGQVLPVPLPDPDAVIPLPVVEAEARWLSRLASLLLTPEQWVPLTAWLVEREPLPAEPAHRGDPGEPTSNARDTVDGFRASVSPDAFELATLVAAVPLDVEVMRDVQRRALPRSGPSHLAEVLTSPLVRPQPPQRAGSLQVRFRFASGVREELLAAGRRSDIYRVLRALNATESRRPDSRVLTTVLDSDRAPSAPPPAVPENLPWLTVRASVLQAMGGEWRSRGLDEQATLDRLPAEGQHVSQATHDPRSTTPAPRRAATFGNYPLRNPNFTGREELLQVLHDSLSETREIAVLPHALHGMGGVGKSLLAVEYIYRHEAEYDVIWWIPSEQTTRIQSSLVELGQRLGVSSAGEANAVVPAVLDALRRDEPYARWLLVFDNAEGPEQVREYLPVGGSGHVLITSRDARWSQVSRPLEVDVFEREESIQLLRRRGPDISVDEADRLAEALGDLPLAIEQAAAWHAETGTTVEEYLQLLRDKQTELLEQLPPMDYHVPVIAAWSVSLDRLEARNPAAAQLLKVCAFFAAEPIPRGVFAAARTAQVESEPLKRALGDPIRFGRAVREINRYSLARIDHRTGSIQMHRLVQAALLARMSEQEKRQVRHMAHLMLGANDPGNPDDRAAFPRYADLYPHVIAAEAFRCERDPFVLSLVIGMARYLYRFGDHRQAVELAETAVEAWRQARGEQDEHALELARWLGFLLFATGRYSDAATLNARTLAVYEGEAAAGRPAEDGHLEALRNVAIDRRAQGRFADALEIAEDVHRRSILRYGDSEPETLNAAHNLAVSLRLSGDFGRALDLDQATYARKLEVFGPDHLQTLITRLGLLVDRRELGEYITVEALHQDELDQAARTLGDLNPTTLLARRLLAVAQRKAGHHAAARATSELVSQQFVSRYGPNHPEAMAAQSNLAIDLRQVGETGLALRTGAEIIQRYSGTLGPMHPHTLSARVNAAITDRLSGNVDAALAADTEAFAIFAESLGADHPSTLVAAVNLASDLFAVGRTEEAHDRDADALARLTRVFGPDHPTTLACESNLSLDLRTLGREDEARARHEHSTDGLVRLLGTDHPAVDQADDWDRRADCDLDPMPL